MSSKSGFTLIEMMVVIAIIMILASIAVPSFFKSRSYANLGAQEKWTQTIVDAIEAYSALTGEYPTSVTSLTSTNPPFINAKDAALCGSGDITTGRYYCNFYNGNLIYSIAYYEFPAWPLVTEASYTYWEAQYRPSICYDPIVGGIQCVPAGAKFESKIVEGSQTRF